MRNEELKKNQKGLSLVEAALVLAASGFILAAVWVVASVVWHDYQFRTMQRQIMQTVQNIRDYYGPRGGIPAGTPNLMQAIDQARLFPIEMRVDPAAAGGDINHALASRAGGSFLVSSPNQHRVRVQISNLTVRDCARLLMEFPVLTPEVGVRRVQVNAGAARNINPDAPAIADNQFFPMSAGAAINACNAAGGGNSVSFDFFI